MLYNKESLRSAIIKWSNDENSCIIYLYQLADKRTEKIKAEELHPEISKFFNRLIDCFNDYNLSNFEEFS